MEDEDFPSIPQVKEQPQDPLSFVPIAGGARPELRVGGWQWGGWGRWQWGGWTRSDPRVGRWPVVQRRREKDENREFVHPPPTYLQTECSICLLVLRSPHLASCCSHNFCKECIERVQKAGKPCPLCNSENFTLTYNRDKDVSLQQTEVHCPHSEVRCEWMGKLEMLDTHLNVNPKVDKRLEGCGFVEVRCCNDGCKQFLQRHLIAMHQWRECPLRVFSCEHCREYESTHQDVTTKHWPVCKCYPLPCPRKCGQETIQRQNLEQHVNEECPLLEVECQFKYAGCEAKLPRRDMPDHLRDYAGHMIMFARQNQLLARQNLEVMAKFAEIITGEDAMNADINDRLAATEQKLEANYTKFARQVKETESRRANSISQMERHITDLETSKAKAVEVRRLKVRVEEVERSTTTTKAEHEKLVRQVVSRRELTDLVRKQEATDGSLKKLQDSTAPAAEVATLKKQLGDLAWKQDTVATTVEKLHHHVHTAPVQIVMTNYEQHKRDKDVWCSDGFYTNPHGYKMRLEVDANGYEGGEGTQVSCFIYLMHGEFDNHLKWPFRGTVTITLLNQQEDKNHRTLNVPFTDQKSTARVTSGERATMGWGSPQLIPHRELGYNQATNCQYLVNNCLYFQVKVKLC